MQVDIRPAEQADISTLLHFIRGLADYEREPQAVIATEALLQESLFGPGHVAHALIASLNDAPVGMALYFFNFSTWLGRSGLYLEDLYVTPAARGEGVGRSLLSYLAAIAVEKGCGRMEWSVLDWNEPAIGFYKSLGAQAMNEWTVYRLQGETLQKLAASAISGPPPASPSDCAS